MGIVTRAAGSLVILVATIGGATPGIAGDEKRPPLPDNKTIDSLTYRHSKMALDRVTLTITRGGKVSYTYCPASEAGLGRNPRLYTKELQVPEKESVALLDELVADGLLDLKDDPGQAIVYSHVFTAHYGRWVFSTHPKEVPSKIADRLLPLFQKAHPELWKLDPAK